MLKGKGEEALEGVDKEKGKGHTSWRRGMTQVKSVIFVRVEPSEFCYVLFCGRLGCYGLAKEIVCVPNVKCRIKGMEREYDGEKWINLG